MVRPKDSIALSKKRSTKAKVDFKSIRNTRKNVIGLVILSIVLALLYTSYELYITISDSEQTIIKIITTLAMFMYIIFLIFEINILYFHLAKFIKISIFMDVIFNISLLTLTICQSITYNIEVVDIRFLLPLIIIIVIEMVFIFRGFIFYNGMYVMLKNTKNSISTALLSQKSFNEKLLQSLIPDETPNREEQIQVSLDEFEQLSRQASDYTPQNTSQITNNKNGNNNINY